MWINVSLGALPFVSPITEKKMVNGHFHSRYLKLTFNDTIVTRQNSMNKHH